MHNNIFTRELLESSLREAIFLFKQKDQYLLEHNVMEVSISGKIACYLESVLNKKLISLGYSLDSLNLSLDVEYNKYGEGKKEVKGVGSVRPDIVLHQRGPGNLCIFVVEIKKGGISERDKEKVQGFIDDPKYNYSFGACVGNLSSDAFDVEIYSKIE